MADWCKFCGRIVAYIFDHEKHVDHCGRCGREKEEG